MKKLIIYLIVIVLMVLPIASDCGKVNSYVDRNVADGVIGKISYADYYIDDFQWRLLNVNQKEMVLHVFASHYECHGGAFRAVIYSFQTGKKLGKIGAFGVKFY